MKMKNLLQQARQFCKNGDFDSAKNLYFQIYEQALLNVDFENVFFCLQKILEIFPSQFQQDIVERYFSAYCSFLNQQQENQHLSNLQNILQNQHQNVNLRLLIAEILFYQAQSCPNLDGEQQKLLQAKNLIADLDFEAAQYQKMLISAYLSQNIYKSAPPPPHLVV